MKNALLFAIPFVLGATGMLVYRGMRHDPYALPASPPPSISAATDASAEPAPVNSICPICGMDVNPAIPTAEYRGQRIGFGCAACPPRFAKDPERWGPAALENRVAE